LWILSVPRNQRQGAIEMPFYSDPGKARLTIIIKKPCQRWVSGDFIAGIPLYSKRTKWLKAIFDKGFKRIKKIRKIFC